MEKCEHADEIVCPYCGYEFSDSYEHIPSNGEECTTVECEECEREFGLTIVRDLAYTSYCADGEHEYEHHPTTKYPDCYECSNCGDMQFKSHIESQLAMYKERGKQIANGDDMELKLRMLKKITNVEGMLKQMK